MNAEFRREKESHAIQHKKLMALLYNCRERGRDDKMINIGFLWVTIQQRDNWKIQQSLETAKYRLIDPLNRCRKQSDNLKAIEIKLKQYVE